MQKTEQYELFDNVNSTFRPIHYLGSKLRVIETISDVIDEIDPTFGRVYDLFSGSGTVSYYLGKKRPVTSVDIQEYSRILTSGVLMPLSEVELENMKNVIISKKDNLDLINQELEYCISPLLEYEEKALKMAKDKGDIFPICELVEYGSLWGLIHNEPQDISKDFLKALITSKNRLIAKDLLYSIDTTTTKYFGGTYFSYKQSLNLDKLLELGASLEGAAKEVFLAAILSTASEIVNTVGKQFAQPLKTFTADKSPKKNVVAKIERDRSMDVFIEFKKQISSYLQLEKGNYNHKTLRIDYEVALDELTEDTKVVYADPPYTRYHYSRYYHVLETLCLRDNPQISTNTSHGITKLSRGMYRLDRHQSTFSIKSKAGGAFYNLFKKCYEKRVALILSYSPFDTNKENTPRMQTIDELMELAENFYESVEIITVIGFTHAKLNKTNNNFEIQKDAEVLLVCKNPKSLNTEREANFDGINK